MQCMPKKKNGGRKKKMINEKRKATKNLIEQHTKQINMIKRNLDILTKAINEIGIQQIKLWQEMKMIKK